MKSTRIWRLGTAAVAASALLMTTAGGVATAQVPGLEELDPETIEELLSGDGLQELADELGLPLEDLIEQLEGLQGDEEPEPDGEETDPADAPDTQAGEVGVPGAELGGFIGEASATGLSIGVGLPAELAEPLAPLFEGLGIAGTGDSAIAINLAETNANLQRAAEGEEVDGLADALILNLLLGSGAADRPGSCQGADTVALPDEQTPVLRVTVADIDCEQDDERAFASAHVAGASINLGNLIDLAGAEALREGLDQVIEPVNDEILAQVNDGCREALGSITEGVIDNLPLLSVNADQLCESLELNLQNVFNVDVPLLDVDLLESSSEVTNVDGVVTATGTSGLARLELGGMVCVEGTNPGDALQFVSTASTDGETGTADAQASNATARLCTNPALGQIVDAERLLNSIEISGQGAADLVDLDEVTEGLEEGLATLLVDADNSLSTVTDTQVDGAGAAAEARLDVLNLQLFRGIEPLAESPLGAITVSVTAMDTSAGVNAAPDTETIPAQADDPAPAPEDDLPRTGASLAGLVGLAALGAGVAMRRRDQD